MKTTGTDLGALKAYVGELEAHEKEEMAKGAAMGRRDIYAELRQEGFEIVGKQVPKEATDRFNELAAQLRQDYERTSGELKRTRALYYPLQGLVESLENHIKPMADIPPGVGPAENALYQRLGLTRSIEAVSKMVLAGGPELAAKFPTAQLELIDKSLKQEIETLRGVIAKGNAPKVQAPVAQGAPPVKGGILSLAQIPSIAEASAAIGRLLGDAGLEKLLTDAIGKLKGPERDRFEAAVQGMAMVADFATGTLDYRRVGGPMFSPPENRADHRVRNFPQHMVQASQPRQQQAKGELAAALKAALGNADLAGGMESTLIASFLAQVSVPPQITANWKPDPKAVITALSDELFAPLRALNEMIPGPYTGRYGGDSIQAMQTIVRDMTRAVVEGRYEEWRVALPQNQAQLDVLPKDKQAAWMKSSVLESKTANGVVKSHEAEGHERFWATKIGGPSHAFDVMSQCVLSILGNVRTKAIVIDHDAFDGGPGARAYLRLLGGEDGKPVLFLEGLQLDFKLKYRNYNLAGDLKAQMAKHAIAKAKELGARLIVSGEYNGDVMQQGFQTTGPRTGVVLMPSAVVCESSDTLLGHDDRQTEQRVSRPWGFAEVVF